jgi:hypothetical protein
MVIDSYRDGFKDKLFGLAIIDQLSFIIYVIFGRKNKKLSESCTSNKQ